MSIESNVQALQSIVSVFHNRIEAIESAVRQKLEAARLEQDKPTVIEQQIRLSLFNVARIDRHALARRIDSAPELARYLERYFRHLAHEFANQLEVARASGDDTDAAKNELKLEALQTMRNEFRDAYSQVTGERPEGVWA